MGDAVPAHWREAICWRVMSELVRRHPRRLWVQTATHSIGSELGFLIDLSDPSSATPRASFGMPGTYADPMAVCGPLMKWDEAFSGPGDPRDWIHEFERRMALEPPAGAHLPRSSAGSLAIRLVATLLATKVGDRVPWIAGGAHRWPGDHDDRHDLVPHGSDWRGAHARPEPVTPLFAGPWPAGPVLAISPDGDLWTAQGEHRRLQDLHKPGGSITELVVAALSTNLLT